VFERLGDDEHSDLPFEGDDDWEFLGEQWLGQEKYASE
jgi:hypothetical protein